MPLSFRVSGWGIWFAQTVPSRAFSRAEETQHMFAAITPTAGTQPFNDWFVPDTVQRQPLGMIVMAVDPFWGTGEFIYVKSNDAILKGSLVMWDEAYLGVLLPTTTLQGFPFGVAMAPIPSASFGWLQISGRCVYKTNAT